MEFVMQDNIRIDIGEIGEQVVQRHFNSSRSENWYDSEKDGMIGNQTYEIKTFRLNNKTKSFWVGQNKTKTQWDKIQNVDRLFFVKIPENENELAVLYECHDHRECWYLTERNDGTPIRAFPLTNCEELDKLTLEESRILYENSKKISTHKRYTNGL